MVELAYYGRMIMCGGPSDFRSEDDFLRYMLDQAADQRQGDGTGWRDCKPARAEDGSLRPEASYRPRADMSLAYSTHTKHIYVGYSGGAGGMMSHGKMIYEDQGVRRRGRLADAGLNPSARVETVQHLLCNCAEAAAYSIALAFDELLSDLNFTTFYPHVGQDKRGDGLQRKRPCPNCQKWLTGSGGFWDDGWRCTGRGPGSGPGSGAGQGGFGSGGVVGFVH
jgi:hypothetical protein